MSRLVYRYDTQTETGKVHHVPTAGNARYYIRADFVLGRDGVAMVRDKSIVRKLVGTIKDAETAMLNHFDSLEIFAKYADATDIHKGVYEIYLA